MKRIEKEEIIGFSTSLVILLILGFLLWLVYLRAEIKPESQEVLLYSGGVELNQGELDWEGGNFTPTTPSEASDIPPVITDNSEPTPVMDFVRIRVEAEQRREQERLERERREAERQANEINALASNAFAQGNQGSGQAGAGTSSFGGGGEAAGSGGSGGSFDLGGRGLHGNMGGRLPFPAYNVQEEGIIVVEVTVNPEGQVIKANVRPRGTNISNERMRTAAVEAARKARFAVINQPDNQTGTISYRYKLN